MASGRAVVGGAGWGEAGYVGSVDIEGLEYVGGDINGGAAIFGRVG